MQHLERGPQLSIVSESVKLVIRRRDIKPHNIKSIILIKNQRLDFNLLRIVQVHFKDASDLSLDSYSCLLTKSSNVCFMYEAKNVELTEAAACN